MSCPPACGDVFTQIGQKTAPLQSVVEGIGEAVGLKDLADGVTDLGSGRIASGSAKVALALPFLPGGKAVRAAREIEGGVSTAGKALEFGAKWLGEGYREIAEGVFRSADDARQFRMTVSDLTKDLRKGMHVHFEAIAADGKKILESTWLRIKP